MAKVKTVLQTRSFKNTVKKLKPSQKKVLDNAIEELMKDPSIGEQKKGNLAFLRVHKFKINKQLMLLGYSFSRGSLTLELLALGSHENSYRDLRKRI